MSELVDKSKTFLGPDHSDFRQELLTEVAKSVRNMFPEFGVLVLTAHIYEGEIHHDVITNIYNHEAVKLLQRVILQLQQNTTVN